MPQRPSPFEESVKESLLSISKSQESIACEVFTTKSLVQELIIWQNLAMSKLCEHLGVQDFTPPSFPIVSPSPTREPSPFPSAPNDFEAGPSHIEKEKGGNVDEEEVEKRAENDEDGNVNGVEEHEDEHVDFEQEKNANIPFEEQEEDVVFLSEEEEAAITESIGVEIAPLEECVDANLEDESLMDEPITPTTPTTPLTPSHDEVHNFIISSRTLTPFMPTDMSSLDDVNKVDPFGKSVCEKSGKASKNRRLVKKPIVIEDDDDEEEMPLEDSSDDYYAPLLVHQKSCLIQLPKGLGAPPTL